jgi:cation-dependent mannose-6-phosphate receptor
VDPKLTIHRNQDLFTIIGSSLGRVCRFKRSPGIGHSRGDSQRGGFIGGISGRRDYGRDVDAENRLIDQLDEEWED